MSDMAAMEGIKMISSAEEPAVAGSSSVPVGGDVFDGGSVAERNHERSAVLGDDDEHGDLIDEDYFISDDEDDDGVVDIDSEFEEDDEVPKIDKRGEVLASPCEFLDDQPARLAAIQGTVCFMRFATFSAPPCACQCHHGGGGEIIIDYRYTRFFRTQRGGGDDGDGNGDGVDMHVLGPKQAHLHFVLADSDPVTTRIMRSSLRFAGAVVAALVYPARFSVQLQELWSATTKGFRIPARATRLLVTVDVGILRPGDFTPARRMSMCVALESVARERAALPPTAFHFDVAAELCLPALLRSDEDQVRPAKRRRVTGEDCPICWEVLERGGQAAWPRCLHVFHARCLEQHLLRGHQECPLCRSELQLSPCPSCGE